jgi:hypothetical protein
MKKVEITKHLLFTTGFIGLTFGVCTFARADSLKKYRERVFSIKDITNSLYSPTPSVIYKQSILPQFLFNIKEIIRIKVETARPSQITTWSIIGINALVFAAWRIPGLAGVMKKHFVHVRQFNIGTNSYTPSYSSNLCFFSSEWNTFYIQYDGFKFDDAFFPRITRIVY